MMIKNLLIALVLLLLPFTCLSEETDTGLIDNALIDLQLAAADDSTAGTVDMEKHEDVDEEFFDDDYVEIADPLEFFNRGIFWFNDKLYFYALKPVAKVFRKVPEPARISLSNFFSNITTPVRLVNALLQVKVNDAGTEFTRFVVNTTLGIGGLFDPASEKYGLRKKIEDTGQTLGHYGAGQGFYLVLPFLGPSSLRDSIGRIGDTALDPVSNYLQDRDYWITKTTDVVNEVSLDKDTYEAIVKDSLDPYLFVRDAYVQYRAGLTKE